MNPEPGQRQHVRKGFLVAVLWPLSIGLAIFCTTQVNREIERRRELLDQQIDQTRATMDRLAQAVSEFLRLFRRLPTHVAGGHELFTVTRDAGPWASSRDRHDAWGNEFEFHINGQQHRITSPGPDCRSNTDDDVDHVVMYAALAFDPEHLPRLLGRTAAGTSNQEFQQSDPEATSEPAPVPGPASEASDA